MYSDATTLYVGGACKSTVRPLTSGWPPAGHLVTFTFILVAETASVHSAGLSFGVTTMSYIITVNCDVFVEKTKLVCEISMY